MKSRVFFPFNNLVRTIPIFESLMLIICLPLFSYISEIIVIISLSVFWLSLVSWLIYNRTLDFNNTFYEFVNTISHKNFCRIKITRRIQSHFRVFLDIEDIYRKKMYFFLYKLMNSWKSIELSWTKNTLQTLVFNIYLLSSLKLTK